MKRITKERSDISEIDSERKVAPWFKGRTGSPAESNRSYEENSSEQPDYKQEGGEAKKRLRMFC